MAECNRAIHDVEEEYCHEHMLAAGFDTEDRTGVGFVRSFLYRNDRGHEIRWSVGINATYWEDLTTGDFGYWRDLIPHLKKVFAGMLVGAAEKAGIKVPKDPEEYDKEEYPHFYVFCWMQLSQPMPYPGVHYANAEVIASIPSEKIRDVKLSEIMSMGFAIGEPVP